MPARIVLSNTWSSTTSYFNKIKSCHHFQQSTFIKSSVVFSHDLSLSFISHPTIHGRNSIRREPQLQQQQGLKYAVNIANGYTIDKSVSHNYWNIHSVPRHFHCKSSLKRYEGSINDHDRRHENTTYQLNETNWKNHPALISQVFQLPTILVPHDIVHHLLSTTSSKEKKKLSFVSKEYSSFSHTTPTLHHYLASQMEELQDIHPRLKLVRDLPLSPSFDLDIQGDLRTIDSSVQDSIPPKKNKSNFKIMLLNPHRVYLHWNQSSSFHSNHDNAHLDMNTTRTHHNYQHQSLQETYPGMTPCLLQYLESLHVRPGPNVTVTIPYYQQPIHRVLSNLLPSSALPPPTSFEQVGHVIHLNLKEKHLPYRTIIGEILLERFQPNVQTVVNKIGEVSGPYRTYGMEVLAGTTTSTVVQVVEDNIRLRFDLRHVYWCSRLSGERARLIQEEFRANQIIADAFCGVGALCLQAAIKLNATVYANDLNPDAVRYCRENAMKNGVLLLQRLPSSTSSSSVQAIALSSSLQGNAKKKTVKKVRKEIIHNSDQGRCLHVTCGDAFDFIQKLGIMNRLPNHIVMNYPLDSVGFLSALRWWPTHSLSSIDSSDVKLHLYTFAHADSFNSIFNDEKPPRDVIDAAIDSVAEALIPEGGAVQESRFRKEELNHLGCEVRAREVRDVAPGKVVVCVSFKVTNRLIRVMQGDYADS